MTRAQQIEAAAYKYDDLGRQYRSYEFIEGAKFADENPDREKLAALSKHLTESAMKSFEETFKHEFMSLNKKINILEQIIAKQKETLKVYEEEMKASCVCYPLYNRICNLCETISEGRKILGDEK